MSGNSSPTISLIDLPDFRAGAQVLVDTHPDLAPFSDPDRLREWTALPSGFAGLCNIIIGQQVSTKVAQIMWNRFQDLLGGVEPQSVLAQTSQTLRAIGLSRQKSNYILSLAHAVADGEFDPTAINDMDDKSALSELTRLKGIGPWSAEIYLMFCLGRTNIWPAGDLGLQIGVQLLKGLKEKPSAVELRQIGAEWVPYRSIAALMLWRCYLDRK